MLGSIRGYLEGFLVVFASKFYRAKQYCYGVCIHMSLLEAFVAEKLYSSSSQQVLEDITPCNSRSEVVSSSVFRILGDKPETRSDFQHIFIFTCLGLIRGYRTHISADFATPHL